MRFNFKEKLCVRPMSERCQMSKGAAAKPLNYLKAKKLVVNFTPAVNSKINYSNSLRVAIKEKKHKKYSDSFPIFLIIIIELYKEISFHFFSVFVTIYQIQLK